MLLNLKSSGALDNTFFLLLGDHGFQVETTNFFFYDVTPNRSDVVSYRYQINMFIIQQMFFTREQCRRNAKEKFSFNDASVMLQYKQQFQLHLNISERRAPLHSFPTGDSYIHPELTKIIFIAHSDLKVSFRHRYLYCFCKLLVLYSLYFAIPPGR